MENAVVYARIGDYGQEVYAVEFPWTGELTENDVNFTGTVKETDAIDRTRADRSGIREHCVQKVTVSDGTARVEVIPFLYIRDFRMVIGGEEYDFKSAPVKTDILDEFEFHETEDGVSYRLYSPQKPCGVRPLILFLHGMGGTGTDNALHLTECYGGTAIAGLYPWCYVMAPQCHPEIFKSLPNIRSMKFRHTKAGGWNQSYLARVCDIIREMIADGRVDPKRVYVTGLSMGGAGTIRAINTAPDLFAAAVAICPSMAEDTYDILRNMTHTKIWAVASYVDHGIYRHKYITDAMNELRADGNRDARLTVYGPEELAEFGVADTDDITQGERIAWNHWVWLAVYKGDKGIMSWMMNQCKD